MANCMLVSLSLEQATDILNNAIINGSMTGECADSYDLAAPGNTRCRVLVYEKHYYRAGNRLTLTVTLDNFTGPTRICCVGGGGGEGFFSFDWGAADSFAQSAIKALRPYQIATP